MSRSRRKTPIIGNGGYSEKWDKQTGNRRIRKKVNQMMKQGDYDGFFPIQNEVIDKWCMAKDGKSWFGDMKNDSYWKKYYDKDMRK